MDYQDLNNVSPKDILEKEFSRKWEKEEIEEDVLSLENEEEENKKYRCPNCEFEAVLNDFIKRDEK